MDNKTESTFQSQDELYEFYQLMRWLKKIKVKPNEGAKNQWVYQKCKALYEQGILDKEEVGNKILFSLEEAELEF